MQIAFTLARLISWWQKCISGFAGNYCWNLNCEFCRFLLFTRFPRIYGSVNYNYTLSPLRPTRLSSFTLFPVFHFFSSSFHIRGTIQNVWLSRGRSGTRSFHAPLALMFSHAGRLWKVVQTPRWARPCSLSQGLTPQTRCPPTSSKINDLGET